MASQTHKVLMVVNMESYPMLGDGDETYMKRCNVLPELLREGWGIESCTPVNPGSKGEARAYFILQRKAP